MKRNKLSIHPIAALALAVVLVAGLASPAYAYRGSDDSATTTVTTATTTESENESETESESQTDDSTVSGTDKSAVRKELDQRKQAEIEKRKSEAEAKVAEKQEAVKTKLESKKLEVCQKRESKVQDIMERVNEHGTKQLAVFDKIATRTQDFYVAKGYTIANYDELVTAVSSTKAAAEAQVAATKSISVDFNCESENPLGTAAAFKASVEAQKTAMKAYKTAVKNLIVGVKSAAVAQPSTETSTGETN